MLLYYNLIYIYEDYKVLKKCLNFSDYSGHMYVFLSSILGDSFKLKVNLPPSTFSGQNMIRAVKK